jgi:hypothetical protein
MNHIIGNPLLSKTPHPELKLKFLKIDMIRLSVLRNVISRERYQDILNKSITDNRNVINS